MLPSGFYILEFQHQQGDAYYYTFIDGINVYEIIIQPSINAIDYRPPMPQSTFAQIKSAILQQIDDLGSDIGFSIYSN